MNEEAKLGILQALEERRSIRKYTADLPTNAQMAELMNAALEAPTGRNAQSNEVYFIRNEQTAARLQESADNYLQMTRPDLSDSFHCFYDAPMIAILSADPDNKWKAVDAGIIAENICLAAYAVGLGTCMIGMVQAFMSSDASRSIRSELGIDEELEFQIAVAIGVPDQEPDKKPRDADKIKVIY